MTTLSVQADKECKIPNYSKVVDIPKIEKASERFKERSKDAINKPNNSSIPETTATSTVPKLRNSKMIFPSKITSKDGIANVANQVKKPGLKPMVNTNRMYKNTKENSKSNSK